MYLEISNVPDGWRLMRLEEVCHKITDGTHKTPNYQPSGVRFISIKNIRPFQPINWKSYEKYISPAEHRELTKRCKPEYDDILFPRIGTLGFAKRIDFQEEVSIFVGLGLLKPRREIVRSKFLELWMNTPLIQRLSHERANGSGRLTLPLEESRLFPVLVPPFSEQDAIVSEIEKQFTRLEAGVAGLRRVQANLKRYRAAVLKAACEGKLVPTEAELARQENRTYETGAQLLERILTERREKWNGKGKYQEPEKPDMANLPPAPRGWTWASLDQLQKLLRNGISKKPDAEKGLPILRISAVRALSVNLSDTRYLKAQANDYAEFRLSKGDILFTRYNGNPDLVGVCGVVPDLSSDLVHPDKLIRCKLVSDELLPKFIGIMVNIGASRGFLAKRVRTTAGQAGISGGDLKALPIPVAPFTEQQRIVAEVERRLSVVEELEAVVNANLQRATRLRQSILQKAFSGNLSTL